MGKKSPAKSRKKSSPAKKRSSALHTFERKKHSRFRARGCLPEGYKVCVDCDGTGLEPLPSKLLISSGDEVPMPLILYHRAGVLLRRRRLLRARLLDVGTHITEADGW